MIHLLVLILPRSSFERQVDVEGWESRRRKDDGFAFKRRHT